MLNEDIIGLYIICSIAKSYKYIRKYGLFHLVDNPTASKLATKDHYLNMDIFVINSFKLFKYFILNYLEFNYD